MTLVDAKNLLSRLMDGEHELMTQEKQEEGPSDTVDEAFQQIMFSDRIVINKVCVLFVEYDFCVCVCVCLAP